MFHIQSKRHILYAVSAVLLLLQSFAVWHDVVHPYHIDEIQCDGLRAINHLPTADIHSSVSIAYQFVSIQLDIIAPLFTQPTWLREQYAIRAPPVFS
jgi:hypothetical protein